MSKIKQLSNTSLYIWTKKQGTIKIISYDMASYYLHLSRIHRTYDIKAMVLFINIIICKQLHINQNTIHALHTQTSSPYNTLCLTDQSWPQPMQLPVPDSTKYLLLGYITQFSNPKLNIDTTKTKNWKILNFSVVSHYHQIIYTWNQNHRASNNWLQILIVKIKNKT